MWLNKVKKKNKNQLHPKLTSREQPGHIQLISER